jgi:hypothetical protein
MTSTKFLQPKFDSFPPELTKLSRWVGFDMSKRPLCPSNPSSLASINEPSHWASFNETKTVIGINNCVGLGIVLNGDGLVGFDFDGSVKDGIPDDSVLDLLQWHQVQYIEFSPSGRGIRAFGYADQKKFSDWPFRGRRGTVQNLAVEIYADQRFLTVTGHVIRNEGVSLIHELPQLLGKIHPSHLQKTTDEHKGNLQYSSVYHQSSSVGDDAIADLIPVSCIPNGHGQRHYCLFRLARYLRGLFPNTPKTELRNIVQYWHQISLPNIRTKEFAISWHEFFTAWEKIKHPYGATLNVLLDGADEDISCLVSKFGYGGVMQKLLQTCMKLQRHSDGKEFFLSARKAGELVGLHFTDASRLLQVLVADEVLILVKKGKGLKASRYKINKEVLCTI